jgi:phosphopantothenoylcysteine decarboxylase/phosphopantothenate--cysteine ligase
MTAPMSGRRILLGVTGGIAAYKSAYLARRLGEQGAEVRVIMTAAAERFVGRQTFAAITGNPVERDLFDGSSASPHTDLAAWAELIVVAPATTNLLGHLANGLADDLLTNTLLAARTPVLLAPAMHTEMWEHPATQRNLATLTEDGHHIVGPESGELAGGDAGVGRMSEPEAILAVVEKLLEHV